MIYLDYNATHPPYKEIISQANQTYLAHYGNSSGRSSFSQQSKRLIETARKNIADTFSVSAEQIIFTSSATEANFLVIQMLCAYLREVSSHNSLSVGVSPLEHPSVMEVLKKCKPIELHVLSLDEQGQIDLAFLNDALEKKMFNFFVCTLVHGETGIIQPWERLVTLVKRFAIPLVCDATQAISRLQTKQGQPSLSLEIFSASQEASIFFTMCGHKIGAGFGTGVVIIPSQLPKEKISKFTPFYDGDQEFSFRPGSHNLASIIAFEKVLSEKIKKKRIILN